MRHLFLAALSLATLPAVAQDAPESPRSSRIVIEIDTTILDGLGHRFEIETEEEGNGPRVFMRRFFGSSDGGESEENVFRFRSPESDGEGAFSIGSLGSWIGEDGPRLLRGFGFQPGVSEETRSQLREKEREANDIATRARAAEGSERRQLESELTDVLGTVFELRAQTRREEAAHLRERAAELSAEADQMDTALRARDANRRQLIDERRAELLGERRSDW